LHGIPREGMGSRIRLRARGKRGSITGTLRKSSFLRPEGKKGGKKRSSHHNKDRGDQLQSGGMGGEGNPFGEKEEKFLVCANRESAQVSAGFGKRAGSGREEREKGKCLQRKGDSTRRRKKESCTNWRDKKKQSRPGKGRGGKERGPSKRKGGGGVCILGEKRGSLFFEVTGKEEDELA